MRKATLLFLVCLFMVSAASVQGQTKQVNPVDERFAKASKWLNQENLSLTRDASQAFVNNYIIVEGEGLPSREATTQAQKRLTAQRAAEIVAYRNLAQFLEGVAVAGEASIRDMSLKYEQVKIAVTGFVKGAQVVHKEYSEQDEVALVLVKVALKGPGGVGDLMYRKLLNEPEIRQAVALAERPAASIKPVAMEANYDGIIIDATDHNFRPALINRVFSGKGEVLYDPSKISQKILVEKGCGEYTNSVPKAKTALENRGTRNPLIIKAVGTTNPTDLQVSDDDAVKIFSANQKTLFLTEARVAFVLK